LGLNPYDKDIVDEFSPAYLKTGGPTGKMTLVYVLHIRLTGPQFLHHYDEFVKELRGDNKEPEFGQIFCIDMDTDSVEAFIEESEDELNEYMAVLLRAADASRQ